MAGKKAPELPRADYMTPFKLYRTGVNPSHVNPYNEPDPSVISQTIDLSNSISSIEHNTIALIFKRTSGGSASTFTSSVYCTINDETSVLNGTVVLVAVEPSTIENKIITFTKLYSGIYKVLLTGVTGGTFDIYESHSGFAKLGF